MKNKKIPTYIILGLYLVTLITNIILITIYHNNYNTASFINYIILILFSLFFTFHIINTKQERYLLVNVCLICLTFYNILNLNTQLEKMTTTSKATLSAPPINISYLKSMPDFSNESLTSAVKWAKTNNINITQTYEYSDIIEEQNIIYQNVKAGTTLSKIKDLTLVVSDGADPNKEIVLKDMQGLTIDEVLDEIEKVYLNNVKIVYEDSEEKEDSLIKQSKIGTVARSDEITFTFSRGTSTKNEVKLPDFVNMTKLRATAYLEKYKINYEFNDDYSTTVKKGNVIKQSIEKNKVIKVDSDKLTLTISKGKKIIVPDLKNMSLEDILNWVSKNKLKLEIEQSNDDTIKKGKIISTSVNKSDVLEERSKIKVTISKGSIKMKDFDNLDDFKKWAEKNKINYQIEYESNNDIENGKIIRFSHKNNDVIKNNDTITVTISTGKETTIPNFVGLTKANIQKKCNSLEISCTFQYANSKEKKDIAIRQSLSSGSKVAVNTSISITLSNGKATTTNNSKSNTNNSNNNKSNNNQNNNNNNQSNNNSGNNNNNNNTPSPTPEPSCTPSAITLNRSLNNIFSNPEGSQNVYNQLSSYFNSINVKVAISGDSSSGKAPGSFISGIGPGSTVYTCCPNNCKTYSITIAK